MLTTRRGFFGALAALVGVGAAGRVLTETPVPGTWGGIERATFPFWRNSQVSFPERYNRARQAWPGWRVDLQPPQTQAEHELSQAFRNMYHDCAVGGFTHMT